MANIDTATLLSLFFNTVVACSGTASLVWLRLIGGFNSNSMYMFTIWTVVAQILASFVFILSDAHSLLFKKDGTEMRNGPKSKLSSNLSNIGILKFLMFHVSLVMTIATALMFWIICAIDPEALLPRGFFYPNLLNHMHHTFPFIFSFLLMFLFANNEINKFKLKMDVKHANEIGMSFVFFVNSLYSCFIIVTSVIKGKWPYPFLNFLTRLQLGIVIVSSNIVALMISNITNQVLFKIAKSLRAKTTSKKTK